MAFKWLLFVVDYNPLFSVLSIPFLAQIVTERAGQDAETQPNFDNMQPYNKSIIDL